MTALKVALISLGVGLLLGYIGQRSRLCFMGAFRDFFLVWDWRGVRGVAAFVLAAGVTFALGSWAGSPAMIDYPAYKPVAESAGAAATGAAQSTELGRSFVIEEDI